VGTIASGDQFINDKFKNQWLEENIPNLKCVEMEGAAVAQVCYEFDIPFAVIRVISDSANDTSGPDFDRFALEAMCHFTRGSLKAFLLAA
ncbi:MAG: 5'-methylthioadenosine/adenosylhomocysteine nucleosidase, partial [Oscillospiraceae bacterium]